MMMSSVIPLLRVLVASLAPFFICLREAHCEIRSKISEESSSVASGWALSGISQMIGCLPSLLKLDYKYIIAIAPFKNFQNKIFFSSPFSHILTDKIISFQVCFKLIQMQSQDYTLLLQSLQRSINCLTDQDRNIRRTGLTTLFKELQKTSKHNQVRILISTNLSKNLLYTLNDPIEANRQITLNLLQKIIKDSGLKKQEIDPIIQGFIQRINNTPFPEKSQELRQKIISILKQSIVFKDSLVFHIAELTSALSKCLLDPKAEIKNKTCELINDLSSELKGIIGKYATGITKSLAENLKNNKYVVRRNTLITISRLLITEGAGGNFQHVQASLKLSLSDPKVEVRKSALECCAYLLKYMAPKFLKQYEATLVFFLIDGLNDEHPDNNSVCKELLQACGESIREIQNDQIVPEQK